MCDPSQSDFISGSNGAAEHWFGWHAPCPHVVTVNRVSGSSTCSQNESRNQQFNMPAGGWLNMNMSSYLYNIVEIRWCYGRLISTTGFPYWKIKQIFILNQGSGVYEKIQLSTYHDVYNMHRPFLYCILLVAYGHRTMTLRCSCGVAALWFLKNLMSS